MHSCITNIHKLILSAWMWMVAGSIKLKNTKWCYFGKVRASIVNGSVAGFPSILPILVKMRIIAAFLCFFLFVLASGTVSYIYLMWTNYWIRVQSMETKYSAKQSQRLSGNHQRRNVLHRHQKFDTPEKIPNAEKIGTKPKRPRFGRNYELEDITRKNIFLSELPEDKLLAHLRVYKDQLYS